MALLAAMRPSEWTKNLLVFAGLLFSQKLREGPQVVDAIAHLREPSARSRAPATCSTTCTTRRSTVATPRSATARSRAASCRRGSPRVSSAVLAALAIGVAALLVAPEVAGLVAGYGVITIAYTLIVKRLVILDVMAIASLFILRVVAGAVAVEAQASEFLLICTGMLALFLGFTKRRQEAILEQHRGRRHPAGARALLAAVPRPDGRDGDRLGDPQLRDLRGQLPADRLEDARHRALGRSTRSSATSI